MVDVQELLADVMGYAARRGGKIYAPIEHPDFSHIPYQHGPERFEAIRGNMPPGMKTVLDIGTHWGYFAHKLEQIGLMVTAAEMNQEYLGFLRRIRDLYGNHFTIYSKSIFSMEGIISFDVILGLNIFHHFIKKENNFNLFTNFLARLNCRIMFFQAHNPAEGQMNGAFKNFDSGEFCEFLINHTPNLTGAYKIFDDGLRPMFILK